MLRALLSAVLLAAPYAWAQSNQCYWRINDEVRPQPVDNWSPCSQANGVQLCCLEGYECGPDSICRADKKTNTERNESRWMIGGCTDPEFKDSVCRRDCSSDRQTFITYDNSTALWQCCGNNGCDEGDPTDETFKAVSPEDWKPLDGSSKNTNSSPPKNDSDNSEQNDDNEDNNANNDNDNDDKDDGLTTGAKIGIGIFLGLVGIAVIIAAVMLYRRRIHKPRTNFRGVKGRYEEIGIGIGMAGPAARPQSPERYGDRGLSPQPYGRSVSPVPPVRSMEPQRGHSRGRSASPAVSERMSFPLRARAGQADGEEGFDEESMLSRGRSG